jgi:hypothetical protein
MRRIVPDKFCVLAQIGFDRVESVVIAIAAGEDDNAEVHRNIFVGRTFLV